MYKVRGESRGKTVVNKYIELAPATCKTEEKRILLTK